MGKRIPALLAAAALGLSLCGCSSTAEDKSLPTIGIVQMMEHTDLDEVYRGVTDALTEAGYVDGETVNISFGNGQNDVANMKTIVQGFVSDESDVIIAIATAACQSAAMETEDIPIVGAAVTDFEAARLVDNNEVPGGNVTGVSDMNPVDAQLDLLTELVPDAGTVGVLYCINEINAEVQVEMAKEYLEGCGIACKTASLTSVNELAQVLEPLCTKVDAVYIPVDNTLAGAMPVVSGICKDYNVPLVVSTPAMTEIGALGALAFNYYDLGVQAGEMAVRILEGASPAETPVEGVHEIRLYLNKTYADLLGIDLPADLLDAAEAVY